MQGTFDCANIQIEQLNERCAKTMSTAIGLSFTKVTTDSLEAEMTVSELNCQPLGHLNGGASMAAVEIVGSMAANLVIDRDQYVAVGQNIQGSHFRPAKIGETVTAIASALHVGRKSHVWEVDIVNASGKRVCKGSITMAVIPIGN